MTGGAHGGDVAEAVSPLSLVKASVAAAAGYGVRRWRASNFDCHGNALIQRGAHHLIEHVQGFTGSHWMPPSGECLHRIAPAATMVNEFVEITQNTNKTQLLTSNFGTFRVLVISENFIPQNGPSTQLINATSFV
jgi:hypothetical protein